jgi:hypothetical protein
MPDITTVAAMAPIINDLLRDRLSNGGHVAHSQRNSIELSKSDSRLRIFGNGMLLRCN